LPLDIAWISVARTRRRIRQNYGVFGALLASARRMKNIWRFGFATAVMALSLCTDDIRAGGLADVVGGKETQAATDEAKFEQAKTIRHDLLCIEIAVDQFTVDHNRVPGDTITVKEWQSCLPKEDNGHSPELTTSGKNIFGESYGDQKVDVPPTMPAQTAKAMEGVEVPPDFWPHGNESIANK
jgi:hypothetical protein